MIKRMSMVAAAAVVLGACAVRLGGPSPEEYQAVALPAAAGESPEAVAERVRASGAELVLLAAPTTRDSAWFAQIAAATGLQQSGPGRTGTASLGFLTPPDLELLGDTSIVLAAGAGRLHMHDALYQVDKNRVLDMMLVTVDTAADLREAVRTLFSYISTDVGSTAAVVLGLDMPTPQAADSISVLMRAYLPNAHECAARHNGDGDVASSDLRLFYGPVVRIDCLGARTLAGPGNPITARLQVGR